MTFIRKSAFKNCYSIKTVYSYRNIPPSAYNDTFEGIDYSTCVLHVPTGSYQDYWLAEGWENFENIVEFDPTGIDHATTSHETTEMSRYTLDGQKLATPVKGMNIVKYSDGTVKKVVVK